MMQKDGLLELLEQQGVPFKYEQHQLVLNMAESKALNLSLLGARCKNLLLQEKKGNLYLVVTTADKSLDLSMVAKALDSKRLSFASSERLLELLGVRPGALSPLALINDQYHAVDLVIDEDLVHAPHFMFHPLDSTATISLSRQALDDFLKSIGHAPSWRVLKARVYS